MIIKTLLLLCLAGVGLYAFRVTSSAAHLALRRIAGALILLLGCASILVPGITSWMAEVVGVGRGADLVFYAMTVVSLFVWASVYGRLHALEQRQVALVRALAIAEARTDQSSPHQDAAAAQQES
jgi:hypothetical protein